MNQQDDLEKFIRSHRDAFDDEMPDDAMWQKLQHSLSEEISGSETPAVIRRLSHAGKKWMSVAAVFLLCIFLAAFMRTYQVNTETMNTVIPADLQEAQAYYEGRITTKIERIRSLDSMQNKTGTDLWQLFGQRDDEYDRLCKALQENPGNEHVRAAFVEYYRSRLEVLKGIEKRLEQKNK